MSWLNSGSFASAVLFVFLMGRSKSLSRVCQSCSSDMIKEGMVPFLKVWNTPLDHVLWGKKMKEASGYGHILGIDSISAMHSCEYDERYAYGVLLTVKGYPDNYVVGSVICRTLTTISIIGNQFELELFPLFSRF